MLNSPRPHCFSLSQPRPKIDIWIGEGIVQQEAFIACCRNFKMRIALFADINIRKQAEKLQQELQCEMLLIQGDEKNKTREAKQQCEDFLLTNRFGRDTLILAMGGGVTTDLVGFVASTYMRGIPLILIPTTLLGMVDAAIGGKTAINTSLAKNCIGSFYLPASIWIDLHFLKTLPESELLNGLAEILKYGLIQSKDLWEQIQEQTDRWKTSSSLLKWIQSSVEIKMGIIEQDLAEKGIRRILNFGHTIAHAIEHLSQYQTPHGAAVALGCQAESALSHHMGLLSTSELNEILSVYSRFQFPRALFPPWNRKQFLDAMILDKKTKNKEACFVLIDRIGHTKEFDGSYCRPVASSAIDFLLDWLEKHCE